MHQDLPALGSLVGPWRILDRLDSGTYGVVFRAQHATQPESPPVALKVAKLPEDPRFVREAEALQHSHHPSIPRYEDHGVWVSSTGERYPYLVMEAVEGSTLYGWFLQQPRSSLDVLRLVVQLAGALASAHARGLLHRDVKGDNIRVTAEGRAVLLDWGSCWMPSARPLTDTPAPPGTSAYRPPEQRGFIHVHRQDTEARWESRPSDDLYSLGVTLYRLVTGSYLPPCTDGNGLVEREVPKPSERVTVSPALEALILRLISDDRQGRGTAEQLAREAQERARTRGPDEDKHLLPIASALPLERGPGELPASSDGQHDMPMSGESSTEPSRRVPSSCASTRKERPSRVIPARALAFALGVTFVLWVVSPSEQRTPSPQPEPWIAAPQAVAPFTPDAGVVEEALTSVQDVPGAVISEILSYGRPMPSKPLPGQRTPPCKRGEREIRGGCWRGPIEDEKAPCGDEMFDYEGKCYVASGPAFRGPASEDP